MQGEQKLPTIYYTLYNINSRYQGMIAKGTRRENRNGLHDLSFERSRKCHQKYTAYGQVTDKFASHRYEPGIGSN